MTKSKFGESELVDAGSRFGESSPAEETATQESSFFERALMGGAKSVLKASAAAPEGAGAVDTFGQQFAQAGVATPAGAGIEFLAGAVGTSVEEIAETIFGMKSDIAGSVAGGITGARVGAPGGVPGRLVGSFVGSILGSSAGKEIDQDLFETQDEQDFFTNVVNSSKEELAGRVLSFAGKPIINLANKVVTAAGGRMGSTAPKSIDDLFLKDESGRTVKEAEKSLLGEEALTTFEATGGRAGGGLQARLDANAVVAGRNAVTESATLSTRKNIFEKIKNRLSPGTSPDNLSKGIKAALAFAKNSFDVKLDAINKILIPARQKVDISLAFNQAKGLEGVGTDLAAIRPEVFQKLGSKQGQQLTSMIENALTQPTGKRGVREWREKVTLAQMAILKKDIENAISTSSQGDLKLKKEIEGVYASVVEPVLDKYTNIAKDAATGNVRKVFDLQDEFDSVAKARRSVLKSRIARRIGVTEDIQAGKAVKLEKIEDVVFESPQTWKETQDLFDTIGHPETAGALQDRFKQKFIQDNIDAKGQLSFNGVNSFLNKHGDELIRDVAGENWLQAMKDTRLVLAALDETKGLDKLIRSVGGGDNTVKHAKQAFLLPLMRRIGSFNLIVTSLKKSIGLQVEDKTLLKAFQGERGQRLVEQMISTPMIDPKSYNLYVQAVREINKVSGENNQTETLDRKTFLEKMIGNSVLILKSLQE